ncbi:branched-chain amino acid ABC transporter permease [Kerstersia gyiorum]|uniref:branched-chain amino acid ABC transporter permease n=1 Tax=Kerstersia gyiorum TaxID=206506 RepID=UPI00107091DB|nr:branched-chain amino acid ABC transporter permease [Kerstersia gyiorum]QBR40325.1 branched-chain amino acid ABC transporter permease [Kerstersia gyiorum]
MSGTFFINLILNGLIEGMVIALPALALTLVLDISKFPNVAVGDTMTVGAYAALAFQSVGLPYFALSVGGAMAVCMVLSLATWHFVFRRLSKASMVVNLLAAVGLAFMMRSVLQLLVSSQPQVYDFPLVRAWNFHGVRLLPADLWVLLTSVATLLMVFGIFRYTDLGRRLRAIADNPELARASAIRSRWPVWFLWALFGALSALGGVLIASKSVLLPEFGWEFVIPAFSAVILGGIGNPVGAVLGAVLMGVAQELSVAFVGPSYKIVVSFAVLILVLMLRPSGLLGTVEKSR